VSQPSTNITAFQNAYPNISESAWIHPSANIIGNVNIHENASIWCGAVVRGDVNSITIGQCTNIQDLSVLHVSHPTINKPAGSPLNIGNYVTVGHNVILHGCCIHDECLIGMGSLIMDDAIIEHQVIVGAGSLVAEGKTLQSGYLYLGRPAKQIRPLTIDEIAYFKQSANYYAALAENYKAQSINN
jgi:carbonic anhydrase/acetyltransferase-like protein (isoleucine patch superfamily)